MKIKVKIKSFIDPDKKQLIVAHLIKYHDEKQRQITRGLKQIEQNSTMKAMVVNLLEKATNNPMIEMIMNNLSVVKQKRLFDFKINDKDYLSFNFEPDFILDIEMIEEYFQAQATFGMLKPSFKKISFEERIKKEKDDWINWFKDNLKDYTKEYDIEMVNEDKEKNKNVDTNNLLSGK